MSEAMAMPGNTADALLVHAFGRGIVNLPTDDFLTREFD